MKNLLVFVLGVFLIFACNQEKEVPYKKNENNNTISKDDMSFRVYPNFYEMSKDANNKMNTITIDALKQKIKTIPSIYLIDVRETQEYQNGHIDKATNISRGIIEFKLQQVFPNIQKDSEIILYCNEGERSGLTGLSLMKLGYKNIFVLQGGWYNWAGIKPNTKDTTNSKTITQSNK